MQLVYGYFVYSLHRIAYMLTRETFQTGIIVNRGQQFIILTNPYT